ncbi:GTPase/DUF3482 domain-containing protein [Halofilum ochraceum]|uniref:GTPase/DUF3482 domain-containing protein n=1 Tax=Halofilum ochraceum TaxID=1611323 RepID=UPI0008D95E74|nr:GTPase/DUF3482 domain-containing protein [Halofilum ochraceum]
MTTDVTPLQMAVVGHTNAGKTSLVRTLLRSNDFGEVDDRGGTTRAVLSAPLTAGGQTLILLHDSPGLENAPELLDWLEQRRANRHDGPARIRELLDDPRARTRFDQEAHVLELMEKIDVALYVLDAREPVLEKYRDELAILGDCARPIVVVLNFTASPESREQEWRTALAGLGLHTVVDFDAAVRDPATEWRLYRKLRAQLDAFAPLLDQWLDHRKHEEAERRKAALTAIAELLIDAAACSRTVPVHESEQALEEIQTAVRRREQGCVETLLDLYRFGDTDYRGDNLPLSGGEWRQDPFDPETLRHYGIRTGGYLGAGVGGGAAFDLTTGGLSLGAGTLAGTLAGAGASLVHGLGPRTYNRLRGYRHLGIDDAALQLLARRQTDLLTALIKRGHANRTALTTTTTERTEPTRLPHALRRARHHSMWSSLNRNTHHDATRAAAVTSLSRELGCSVPEPDAPTADP